MNIWRNFPLPIKFPRKIPQIIPKRNLSDANEQKSWRIIRLNHIAIANKLIESSNKLFKDMFQMVTSEKHPQPNHGVNTVFVDCNNTKIELLDPLPNCQSPIENFLNKNPEGGVHHLCFEVDNLDAAIKDLRQRGLRLLSEQPKIGAHGKPVIFCHPKDCSGVLIELEQA